MEFKGFDDWIEIFKAGTHTDSAGRTWTFGAADLDRIVAGYDPAVHEAPLVVGHPRDNAPAYGWVGGLKRAGDTLLAKFTGVAPEFEDLVRQGRFKKRSICLGKDGLLRHVGFLGAVPPAVKGLKDLAFRADDAAVTIEFADNQPWIWRSIAGIFRRLREMLIEQGGTEKADAVIPEYAIQDIEEAAKQPETPPEAANQYTQCHKEDRTMSEKMYTEADVTAAVNQAVAKARAELTADFAEQARKDKIKAEIVQLYERPSFNGATPFQAWKLEVDGGDGHIVPASMGPRLFRRGNEIQSDWHQKGRKASMGPRLFRRGNFPLFGLSNGFTLRFNGATPFQAWKLR